MQSPVDNIILTLLLSISKGNVPLILVCLVEAITGQALGLRLTPGCLQEQIAYLHDGAGGLGPAYSQ